MDKEKLEVSEQLKIFLKNLREQLLDAMEIKRRIEDPNDFQRRLDQGWQPQLEDAARGEAFLEPYLVALRLITLEKLAQISKLEMPDEPGLENGADLVKANYWAEVIAKQDLEKFELFCRAVKKSKLVLTVNISNDGDLKIISQNLTLDNLIGLIKTRSNLSN